MGARLNRPRIKIFAFFYNEEFLAPFFIRHYRFADCIHAFVSRSTDRTREILSSAANVHIEDFEFPSGMNDFLKVQKLNETLSRPDPDFDWHIVLDADEFIWPQNAFSDAGLFSGRPHGPGERPVHDFLSAIPATETVLIGRMWNVFRHETDCDLDPAREPVALQRCHGIPDRSGGENAQYQKPIVIRANHGFRFMPGNHALLPNARIRLAASCFDGAHWANADPCFCVQRRIRDRRDRQSRENLQHGLGSQHHHITEADVLALCESHKHDPQVFGACLKAFDELIARIHTGINPYQGYPKEHWPVEQFFEWGCRHPWFHELIEELKPWLIIEVGSFLGGSAIVMAEKLRAMGLVNSAVLCIDTWLAEQILWSMPEHRVKLKIQYGRPCFYYTFLSNIIDRGLQDVVVPLSMPSLSAGRYLKRLGIRSSFIYIDGCHEEGDVRNDLEMYWAILEPGGVMLVDDYNEGVEMFVGLVRDVDRFVAERGLQMERRNDKIVLRKPPVPAETPTDGVTGASALRNRLK
jgi:hypothetical protein